MARLGRTALAVVVLAAALLPAAAVAQDGPEPVFPPVGDGHWEGLVNFSGFISSDSHEADGSFTTKVTDVIGAPTITLDFQVDGEGNVTSGTMAVELTWFDEAVGTAPVTFSPFHVQADHHQTGTLQLSGDASRLVARGTLTYETNVVTEGDTIEEVSGTEEEEVEWVFGAVESTCVRVTGALLETSGVSLIGSSRGNRVSISETQEFHNGLVLQMLVWPTAIGDPEAVKAALYELNDLTDLIYQAEYPMARSLLELVYKWAELNAQLAELDACQAEAVGWIPQTQRSFLVGVIQRSIAKALENQDTYDAQELVDLWDAAMQEQALDGDLVIGLLDAFHSKLDSAIADGDRPTIIDIFVFAGAYGYPDLYAKAQGAL